MITQGILVTLAVVYLILAIRTYEDMARKSQAALVAVIEAQRAYMDVYHAIFRCYLGRLKR